MEAQVLAPLNTLESSLNTLLVALTNTNTFHGAPIAAQDVVAADDALTSSLESLKQHQDNHRRILALRAEADRLQEQLRDIVRTCVDFRSEIGRIHPSMLDEELPDADNHNDDHNDTVMDPKKRKIQPVDYETLLAFAARIGKHNAVAAREADEEAERRRADAASKKNPSLPNGDVPSTQGQSQSQSQSQSTTEAQDTQNTTVESQANLTAINDALVFQRASHGMAFPPPDRLRMGVLGQLQLLREQQGDEAVDAEVQRLVRASENVRDDDAEKGVVGGGEAQQRPSPAAQEAGTSTSAPVARPQDRPRAPRKEAPAQAKVSLDFDEFESDDDDG